MAFIVVAVVVDDDALADDEASERCSGVGSVGRVVDGDVVAAGVVAAGAGC